VRTITTHHTNDANRAITLEADDRNPDNGNASHHYRAHYLQKASEGFSYAQNQDISFQDGPIGEVGVNGVTNELCAAIIIDRLEGFQTSKYACPENAAALEHFRAGLAALESRTKKREARGVEGTHTV
jgi:hypothetical protein